jgi:hypothetical protein
VKKLALLIILVSLGAGCHALHHQVDGSGNVSKEKREIGSFNSISTEGAFDIEIVCQKPASLEIRGDDNILPLISTEVSNNVLRVRNLRGYSVSQPITLKISVPDLVAVSASGAGNIVVSGVMNERFLIEANGAPTIQASGETKALSIDANGAGKIDTHKLHAAEVRVNSKGVPSVEVYASEQLDVTVSGPSRVVYQGDAVVHQTINGPGQIEKKVSEGS